MLFNDFFIFHQNTCAVASITGSINQIIQRHNEQQASQVDAGAVIMVRYTVVKIPGNGALRQ